MWNPDDTRLISCSMDGAIYEWNVESFKRERECVLKTCSYTSVALTPDLRTTFAVGNDHTLKEIILQDSNVSNFLIELQFCRNFFKTYLICFLMARHILFWEPLFTFTRQLKNHMVDYRQGA